MTHATSGRTSEEPYATYDPESRSWKTSPDTSRAGSRKSSQTLPRTGYTRGGRLFAQPTPERRTDVNGCSRLLPTPMARDGRTGSNPSQEQRKSPPITCIQVYFPNPPSWGEFEPLIHRWEAVTRPAPDPAEPNRMGRPRVTARFVEWMVGVPDGYVTDLGLSYKQTIKLLGNAVVPQQAEYALRILLEDKDI